MDLSDLRAELDRIDDALHDLIMRRAEIVRQVAARKAQAGAQGNLRPGREASILRRLLARHDGPLHPNVLVRVWRELLGGALAMQGPFSVAVTPELAAVAHEQFGGLTPLHPHATPAAILAAVRGGDASVGVLPAPATGEVTPWWPWLVDAPRLFVIGRLPFWRPGSAGKPAVEAYVIAAAPPDASGDDRSWLMLPAAAAGRLQAAGFDMASAMPSGAFALADVAGFVAEGDARLAGLSVGSAAPVLLGAYACPVG